MSRGGARRQEGGNRWCTERSRGRTWHTPPPDTLAATRTATSEKGADARAGHDPATNCATKQEVCEKRKKSGNLGAHARAGAGARQPGGGNRWCTGRSRGRRWHTPPIGHPRPVAGLYPSSPNGPLQPRRGQGLPVGPCIHRCVRGTARTAGSGAAKSGSDGCRGMRRAASGGRRGGSARPAPDICRRRSSAGGTQPQQQKEKWTTKEEAHAWAAHGCGTNRGDGR